MSYFILGVLEIYTEESVVSLAMDAGIVPVKEVGSEKDEESREGAEVRVDRTTYLPASCFGSLCLDHHALVWDDSKGEVIGEIGKTIVWNNGLTVI